MTKKKSEIEAMRNQRLKDGDRPLFSTGEATAIRLFFYRYAGVKEVDLAAEVRDRMPGAVVGKADDKHDIDGAAVETMIDVDVTGMDDPTMFLGLDQLFDRLAEYHPQVELLPSNHAAPHVVVPAAAPATVAVDNEAASKGKQRKPGRAATKRKPEPDADAKTPAQDVDPAADKKSGAPDCPRRGRRKATKNAATVAEGTPSARLVAEEQAAVEPAVQE